MLHANAQVPTIKAIFFVSHAKPHASHVRIPKPAIPAILPSLEASTPPPISVTAKLATISTPEEPALRVILYASPAMQQVLASLASQI